MILYSIIYVFVSFKFFITHMKRIIRLFIMIAIVAVVWSLKEQALVNKYLNTGFVAPLHRYVVREELYTLTGVVLYKDYA